MAFDEKLFWHKHKEYNREMVNIARRGSRRFKATIREMMPGGEGKLATQVSYKTRRRNGSITRIGWNTYRYGFIRDYGVDKIVKPHFRTPPGGTAKTVKVKPYRRTSAPRTWITTTMEVIHPEAANIAARLKADDLVEEYDHANGFFHGQTIYGL